MNHTFTVRVQQPDGSWVDHVGLTAAQTLEVIRELPDATVHVLPEGTP